MTTTQPFETRDLVTLPDEGDARYEITGFRPGEVRVRSIKRGGSKWVADTYPILDVVAQARSI